MKKFENIQAVCFDIGNTLLHPYPSVGTTISEVLLGFNWKIAPATLDVQMGAFDRYYSKEYERDGSFWAEEARQREMWINGFAEVCRAVGVDRNLSDIAQACYDEFDLSTRWKMFDGVADTLEQLKECGYRMGVISNWGAGLELLLTEIGIGHYFEVVTASAAAGAHKPMPRAFHLTLDGLGILPQHAVHVGDHMTADVEGSTAVGMHPVLVRHEGYEDPTSGVGCHTIPTITTIPQLLEIL
jgi:putative hydrolase of the HAD superfamily